jgi:hypothetical protein
MGIRLLKPQRNVVRDVYEWNEWHGTCGTVAYVSHQVQRSSRYRKTCVGNFGRLGSSNQEILLEIGNENSSDCNGRIVLFIDGVGGKEIYKMTWGFFWQSTSLASYQVSCHEIGGQCPPAETSCRACTWPFYDRSSTLGIGPRNQEINVWLLNERFWLSECKQLSSQVASVQVRVGLS